MEELPINMSQNSPNNMWRMMFACTDLEGFLPVMTSYFLGDTNEETKMFPERFIFCEGVKAMTNEGNVLCDDLWGEEPKNAEPNLRGDYDECFRLRESGVELESYFGGKSFCSAFSHCSQFFVSLSLLFCSRHRSVLNTFLESVEAWKISWNPEVTEGNGKEAKERKSIRYFCFPALQIVFEFRSSKSRKHKNTTTSKQTRN